MNETEQIRNTIFDQLKQTRINGLPLLPYIGVKGISGHESTIFFKVGKNPKQIDIIFIKYEYGSDTYTITFFRNRSTIAEKRVQDIYADQMGSVITNGMGVN